jgi:hypothetical protein
MSEIERYLDELFDRLAGQGATGRRALAEAEDHLRATAADAMARGLPADQAELDAVARFGSPAVMARKLRSAAGSGRASRAVSVAWLLAGLAAAGFGVAYLAAAGRLGWYSPAFLCTHFLSPSCNSAGGPAIGDTQSAMIAAAAGAALLLGRWLAVRYAGLAPVRRGLALAAGLLLGLVAFSLGMTGQAVALPDSVRSLVPDMLPGPYVTVGATFTIAATMLIECVAAAMSLVGSRPRWYLPHGSKAASARM